MRKLRTLMVGLFLLAGLLPACKKNPPSATQDDIPALIIDSVKVLESDIPADSYTDMAFVNELEGYAVSGNGGVVKTVDGGIHWQKLMLPVKAFLNRLQFVNKQTGYIIGGADTIPSGFLLKTTDAGKTWQRIVLNTPLPGWPTGIYFVDANTGFITGKQFFKKTNDGGQTWVDAAGTVTDEFTDVKFKNSKEGFAVTRDGKYYKTTNGGIGWQAFQVSITAKLGEIFIAPSKSYVQANDNILVDLETGIAALTFPAAAMRFLFLTDHKVIGIGRHYEIGFWPYGDILLTNNRWGVFDSKKFQPGQALNFRAITRITQHKTLVLGEGLLQSTLVQIAH